MKLLHPAPSPLERRWDGHWRDGLTIEKSIIEGWGQGYMLGSLVIMAVITAANMRRRVLLHKLIFIELLLTMGHGTFCLMAFMDYDYYLSATAALLYISYTLHNIIEWMKCKMFLPPWGRTLYIVTVLLCIPYWGLETYANFAFFNNISPLFNKTRPLELLFRDPWWIFTCCNLVWNIKNRYGFSLLGLVQASPRFGFMLAAMALSIIFAIMDEIASTAHIGNLTGINPYWKLSLVFKCLCDTIILDDFASALNRLADEMFRRNNFNAPSKGSRYAQGSQVGAAGADGAAAAARAATVSSNSAETKPGVQTTVKGAKAGGGSDDDERELFRGSMHAPPKQGSRYLPRIPPFTHARRERSAGTGYDMLDYGHNGTPPANGGVQVSTDIVITESACKV